jgi:hypothetical protein
VSGHALAVTFGWLAAAMVLGVAAGIPLARTVAAARGPAVMLCRECQVGSPTLSGLSPSDDEFAETDNGRAVPRRMWPPW